MQAWMRSSPGLCNMECYEVFVIHANEWLAGKMLSSQCRVPTPPRLTLYIYLFFRKIKYVKTVLSLPPSSSKSYRDKTKQSELAHNPERESVRDHCDSLFAWLFSFCVLAYVHVHLYESVYRCICICLCCCYSVLIWLCSQMTVPLYNMTLKCAKCGVISSADVSATATSNAMLVPLIIFP